ncbi:MAG: hypothetical protein L3J07_01685 [Candidatus Magasanikbacteria bacterium]|nr:hypothetical protein [Candidatus Magasanikbacteria bacterium]
MSNSQQQEKQVLTAKQIEKHIVENFQFVKMNSLLTDQFESCVDGRGEIGIVGTPGGNAGEFVLALTTAEKVSGNTIDIVQMREIMEKYCQIFGKFYMHTDTHAIENLMKSMSLDMSLSDIISMIQNPVSNLRENLLNALMQADNVGCGHIKLMMKNPEEYGVRKELVQAVVRSFYELLWSGNDYLEFVVLEGEHQEGAVVNILTVDTEINSESMIPVVVPEVDGEQMFVNHPQAANFMRTYEAQNISELVGFEVSVDDYKVEVEKLGTRQLLTTVGHLAKGLPIFNVVFTDETNFTVKKV